MADAKGKAPPMSAKTMKLTMDLKDIKLKCAVYKGHQKGIGEIVSCEEASGKVVSYIMSAKATDPFLNGDSWGAPRFQAASTGFRWEALVNGPIVH